MPEITGILAGLPWHGRLLIRVAASNAVLVRYGTSTIWYSQKELYDFVFCPTPTADGTRMRRTTKPEEKRNKSPTKAERNI